MRYLVTHPGHEPFLTKWFDYENNWIDGMIVYDLSLPVPSYTIDGKIWLALTVDHL